MSESYYNHPFVIGAIAVLIAAIIGIFIVLRTGEWSQDTKQNNKPAYVDVFSSYTTLRLVLLVWGESLNSNPIVAVIVSGLDIAYLIGYLVVAGVALSYSLRDDWNKSIGYWQIYQLILPILFASVVCIDIASHYKSMPWVFIFAGIIAIALAPFTTRLAYLSAFWQEEKPEQPETPKIWIP